MKVTFPVTPAGLNLIVVLPDSKPVPVTVTLTLLAPVANWLGLNDVITGRALTVKQPKHVPLPAPPGFVTVTSRVPGRAFVATVTLTVIVVLLTKVWLASDRPPPMDTVAPLTK